jgi:futalosine hydrolase
MGEGRGRPLILVPTDLELGILRLHLPAGLEIELCGMGLALSGVLALDRLRRHRPAWAWLLGIAGSHDPGRLPVGSATWFSEVALSGIGVEGDEGVRPAPGIRSFGLGEETYPDPMPLVGPGAGCLLSVAAASGSAESALRQRRHQPSALAEDMEGWAVAAAARTAGVPLAIARGISNVAGDREVTRWRVEGALMALAGLVRTRLEALA